MNIINKEEAIKLQQKWYYLGVSCKNGHIDRRYVNTGICYQCKRDNMSKDYSLNKERVSKINQKSYNKNKEKHLKRSQKWATQNRQKSNQIKINYKLRNIEKVRESARLYQKNQRKDPFKRLSKNLSKSIWENLKSLKSGRSWKSFVSFTLKELVDHLELKFRDGMTWENYGTHWHVDHIKPLSLFDLSKDFNQAWDIKNLQPLTVKENLSKGNKYETTKNV